LYLGSEQIVAESFQPHRSNCAPDELIRYRGLYQNGELSVASNSRHFTLGAGGWTTLARATLMQRPPYRAWVFSSDENPVRYVDIEVPVEYSRLWSSWLSRLLVIPVLSGFVAGSLLLFCICCADRHDTNSVPK
jgi:hypothetical protein